MVCLQKGRWNQFYLQRRIFRTLFVWRVLSLKVMALPGTNHFMLLPLLFAHFSIGEGFIELTLDVVPPCSL